MAKCISCRKPSMNEAPTIPTDDCVELYEIFDGIFYCYECAVKYKLQDKITAKSMELPANSDYSWGTFNAAHK